MAVCPVCGCKTEEIDFVSGKINDLDCKVCSFCNRQLKVFDSAQEPTEAQIRWLDAVISKEVPERDNSISQAISAIRSRYPEPEQKTVLSTQQNVVVQQSGSVKKSKVNNEDDIINELRNRIGALENEIRAMKRKQMIKTIVELGAPFVLLIILIIIVLSSGVIDNFKAIFDMAGIAL